MFTNKTFIKNTKRSTNEEYIINCWNKIENNSKREKVSDLDGLKLKTLTNIYISFTWEIAIGGYFKKRSI